MEQLEKFPHEEDQKYKSIFMGVAMPGTQAGFICVVGATHGTFYEGKRRLNFLDEAESWDTTELIERLAWLDYRFRPEKIYGDVKDPAFDAALREFNRGLRPLDGLQILKVRSPGILLGKIKDAKPFTLIVPAINKLLGGVDRDPDKQRLFVKESSKLIAYLKAPDKGDVTAMTFDAFPAISALAFCVLELERLDSNRSRPPRQEITNNDYDRY